MVDPKFDAFHDGFSMFIPAEIIFKTSDPRWEKNAEFTETSGEAVSVDPSASESGPSSLLVNLDFMVSFLTENDLRIVWTVPGEKLVILPNLSGPYPGRYEFSRTRSFDGNEIRSSKLIPKILVNEDNEKTNK